MLPWNHPAKIQRLKGTDKHGHLENWSVVLCLFHESGLMEAAFGKSQYILQVACAPRFCWLRSMRTIFDGQAFIQ